MSSNSFRARFVATLIEGNKLQELLNAEFQGSKYHWLQDIIHFIDREDLLAFTLKYGHIYGKDNLF